MFACVPYDDWTRPALPRAFDHEYFRNLLHLMIILNMVQVFISILNDTYNLTETTVHPEQKHEQSSQDLVLMNFFKEIIVASGHPNSKVPVTNQEFIKYNLLPFLRSCALFFFHLTGIRPPQELREETVFCEGKNFSVHKPSVLDESVSMDAEREQSDAKLITLEFNAICKYLDIPDDLNKLLQSQEACHLACSWLRHSRVLPLIKSATSKKEETDSLHQTTGLKRAASSTSLKQQQQQFLSLSSTLNTSSSFPSQPSAASPPLSKTELMPLKFIRQPHLVNHLIDLPYDYSQLVDKLAVFCCPSIKNEDSRTPTMCLVCGVMLCSQSYCCQRDLNDLASNYQRILQLQQEYRRSQASSETSPATGGSGRSIGGRTDYLMRLARDEIPALNFVDNPGLLFSGPNSSSLSSPSTPSTSGINQQLVGSCTYHAYECSGGVGVFLRIRNCQILLLSGRSKGCYMAAPYIDDHGETDFGLLRGNPLHLNRSDYEKLQHMWLSHAIPEQISRTLEYSPYASSINWHLH